MQDQREGPHCNSGRGRGRRLMPKCGSFRVSNQFGLLVSVVLVVSWIFDFSVALQLFICQVIHVHFQIKVNLRFSKSIHIRLHY